VGQFKDYVSFKLDPSLIPAVLTIAKTEIWKCSFTAPWVGRKFHMRGGNGIHMGMLASGLELVQESRMDRFPITRSLLGVSSKKRKNKVPKTRVIVSPLEQKAA